jgi:pimeloyl-ACP methyl ester carboxylesterase
VVIVGGGFSFDWGLVQPKVSQFTRICTYDPPGTAWSEARYEPQPEPGLASNCQQTVDEIHTLLTKARVEPPWILVGYSIGGLFARLYAAAFPGDVAGMVIVDHAFIEPGGTANPVNQPEMREPLQQVDTLPVLLSATPIALGIEDDRNFAKLPQLNQRLHAWAMSANPVRPTPQLAAECIGAVSSATKNRATPLGNIPPIVVSTLNDSPKYGELQQMLLSLSRDSRQIIAENSTHMVIVDEPEVIVEGIHQVVGAVRNHRGLRK